MGEYGIFCRRANQAGESRDHEGLYVRHLVYQEAEGDPESGIAPGTRWEDVPLTWRCPDCGAGKEDFEMVEI